MMLNSLILIYVFFDLGNINVDLKKIFIYNLSVACYNAGL